MISNWKEYFKNNYFVLLFLFVVGIAVYGNVLSGDFVFDDNLLVENNALIRSVGNFGQFFTSSSESGAGLSGSNFYRPLQYVAYSIVYGIFGLHSFPFHALSVLLHILNAFLIFLIFQRLAFSRTASLIGSVLFLVHPVNTEAVSYISGIADPLGFLFILLGIFTFLRLQDPQELHTYKDKRKRLYKIAQIFLFFILALLSKESAVVFAPLLLLLTIFLWREFSDERKKDSVKIVLGAFFLMVLYMILKFTVLNFTGSYGLTAEENIYTKSLLVRLITFVSILWEYAKLLLAPLTLYLERPYAAFTTLASLRGLFGVVLIVTGLIFSYKSFFKKRVVMLGFLWFMIAIAPMSGIIPLNAMFLEHWLYVPLVGILILISGAWDSTKSIQAKRMLAGVLVVFTLFFTVRTIARNADWADPVRFYNNELKYTKTSARVYNNLAMEYSERKNDKLAIKYYKKAIELRDEYPQTHYNLANSYATLGDLVSAEKEYLNAIKMSPTFLYSYPRLLNVYKQTAPKKAKILSSFMQKIKSGQAISKQEFDTIIKQLEL